MSATGGDRDHPALPPLPPPIPEDLALKLKVSNPTQLTLTNNGINIDLRIMEGGLCKNLFEALVTTIQGQQKQMQEMRGTIEVLKQEAHHTQEGNTANHEAAFRALEQRVKEVKEDLANLAQNIQGFAEEVPEEEFIDFASEEEMVRSLEPPVEFEPPPEEIPLTCGLFIGGLPAGTTKAAVEDLFPAAPPELQVENGTQSVFARALFASLENAKSARSGLPETVTIGDKSVAINPDVLDTPDLDAKYIMIRNLDPGLPPMELEERLRTMVFEEHEAKQLQTKFSSIVGLNAGIATAKMDTPIYALSIVSDFHGNREVFDNHTLDVRILTQDDMNIVKPLKALLHKKGAEKKIIVTNLALDTTEEDIKIAILQLGVADVRIYSDTTGKSFGIAVVELHEDVTEEDYLFVNSGKVMLNEGYAVWLPLMPPKKAAPPPAADEPAPTTEATQETPTPEEAAPEALAEEEPPTPGTPAPEEEDEDDDAEEDEEDDVIETIDADDPDAAAKHEAAQRARAKLRRATKMVGSNAVAFKPLTEAKKRWRKAIRQVIMMNKKKSNMLGVMKSRAAKGTSIVERLQRLEDRIFNELMRLQKNLAANDEADEVTKQRFEELQEGLNTINQKVQQEYALKKEVEDLGGSVLTSLKEAMDSLKGSIAGESEKTEQLQAEVLKARAKKIALFVKESADEAKQVQQRLLTDAVAGDKSATDMMLADFNLRKNRRRVAELQAKLITSEHELGILMKELDSLTNKDQPETQEALHKANEDAIGMLDTLESCALSLGMFDDSMNDAWESLRGMVDSNMVGESKGLMARIEGLDAELASKATASDLEEIKKATHAEIMKLDDKISTTSSKVEEVDYSCKEVTTKEEDLEKKVTALATDYDQDKKGRREQLEKLARNFVDLYMQKIDLGKPAGGGADPEQIRQLEEKLQVIASQMRNQLEFKADSQGVNTLLEGKASKQDLDTKADEDAVKALEDLLHNIHSDYGRLRGELEKDVAGAQNELETRLMHYLGDKLKNGGSIGIEGAATAKSLLTGRYVPVNDESEYLYEHNGLFPKLQQSWSGDVYRGGFRMPGSSRGRPQTSPGPGGPNSNWVLAKNQQDTAEQPKSASSSLDGKGSGQSLKPVTIPRVPSGMIAAEREKTRAEMMVASDRKQFTSKPYRKRADDSHLRASDKSYSPLGSGNHSADRLTREVDRMNQKQLARVTGQPAAVQPP